MGATINIPDEVNEALNDYQFDTYADAILDTSPYKLGDIIVINQTTGIWILNTQKQAGEYYWNGSSLDYYSQSLKERIKVNDSAITTLQSSTHTHANKTILDLITEAFTTGLKSTYDSAVSSLNSLLTTGARLITNAEITKLSNTSGINTGDETTATIQSKRPLKTVNSISLEGFGDVDVPFPVFGQDASCTGITTPVSTNLTTGYTTNNLVLVAGSYNYSGVNALQVGADYIVFLKWNYTATRINFSTKFRLYHNGVAITNVQEIELKDTTDDITWVNFARLTATGNDTVELRFASENGLMTATVSITDCFIFRIA